MERSARDYVLGIALPDAPESTGPAFESTRAPMFANQKQAVAIGGQLAEFTEAVAPDLRAAISDGILLAQLAANKATAASGDVFKWYETYVEVLQNIGWQIQDFEFRRQQVDKQSLDMHEALIPVITALLGPQVAAASIVVSILQGLQQMDKTRPWITLFDKASQHVDGAKFQVGYVDADETGQPQIALLCFGIQAQRTITQVLFLKSSEDRAEVKKAEARLTVSLARLNSARDALAERVTPFVNDFVKNVEI
ncbi:MAG: hypothetical protein HC807_06350 [Gammaproteobacteria bacterium]|nr:hypothetical protein [Gammaproteobacteria bacterium]